MQLPAHEDVAQEQQQFASSLRSSYSIVIPLTDCMDMAPAKECCEQQVAGLCIEQVLCQARQPYWPASSLSLAESWAS